MANNLTPEQIEKAKAAKSPEELLSFAKENGVDLTEEQADAYFEKLNSSGEVSDNELDNVSGGNCIDMDESCCPLCRGRLIKSEQPGRGAVCRCTICGATFGDTMA